MQVHHPEQILLSEFPKLLKILLQSLADDIELIRRLLSELIKLIHFSLSEFAGFKQLMPLDLLLGLVLNIKQSVEDLLQLVFVVAVDREALPDVEGKSAFEFVV